MPLPWGEGPPCPPAKCIEHPRDKAITLRQLRELADFCRRLCKAGLLRYPATWYNETCGRAGLRIKWTEITQHEIASEVIKKIIKEENSCSWVDLVSGGQPQTRRFFCSHNWSEPFRDFMATIERHAREHRVGPEDSYWICVYANDQWALNLGVNLKDSPFYSALQGAEMTALMLDETAEALERLWVAFEMYETTRTLEQPLEVWTPLGRVGSSLVASGPMVQALASFDTTAAQASNPCDRRQIMNHIAGVDELTGIEVSQDGHKKLDLAGPYEHWERQLVEQYGDRFAVLNESIRQSTADCMRSDYSSRAASDAQVCSSSAKGCNIPEVELRAISLEELRSFAQEVQDWKPASPGMCSRTPSVGIGIREGTNYAEPGRDSRKSSKASGDIEATSCEQVESNMSIKDVTAFIRIKTLSMDCSYVELVAKKALRPQYHITSEWQTTSFEDFMAAVEWHAEARELPDSTTYWIDFLALNLHKPQVSLDPKHHAAYKVIKDHAAGLMLVMDSAGTWATRGRVAWEAYLAIEHSKSFDLLSATGVLATTRPFSEGTWTFGDFDSATARVACAFDVASTIFRTEEERCMVLNSIVYDQSDYPAAPPGPDTVCPEYELFNLRLRRKAAGPVLRKAAFDDDLSSIHWVIKQCPGLRLDDAGLRGVNGEKALHCAAAAGNLRSVRLLLTALSDPNTQDLEGESPLHYAALAGQTETARLLLDSKADPESESYSAETALEITQLNPAGFMGICNTEMEVILQEAEQRQEDARRARWMNQQSPLPAMGGTTETAFQTPVSGNISWRANLLTAFQAIDSLGTGHVSFDALTNLLGGQEAERLVLELKSVLGPEATSTNYFWLIDWLYPESPAA